MTTANRQKAILCLCEDWGKNEQTESKFFSKASPSVNPNTKTGNRPAPRVMYFFMLVSKCYEKINHGRSF